MIDASHGKRNQSAKIARWLPLLAFIAAAAYFWRSDLAPKVQLASLPLLLAATLVQILAFAIRAWLLKDFLRRFGMRLPLIAAVTSTFQPILSKYIPGKVWLLVSTVSLLCKYGLPFARASIVLAIFQVTLALSGLILGALALVVFQLPDVAETTRLLLIFAPFALLTVLLGTGHVLFWAQKRVPMLAKWSGQVGPLPPMSAPIFYGLLHWLVIGLAVTLFLLSVNVDAGWYPLLFQPLAINLGVLAVIVPGGLGVREGAMAAYLVLAGISVSYGLSLAIATRIWFFAVEVLVFFLGLLMDYLLDRNRVVQ